MSGSLYGWTGRPGGSSRRRVRHIGANSSNGTSTAELRAFYPHLRAAGLAVAAARHHRRVAFRTLGDLVHLLLLSPWWLPDFDPEWELDTLLAVEDALGTADCIILTESRYLLTAAKAD
jgi:hypothetical protein